MTGGGIFVAVLLGGVPSRRRWATLLGFLMFAVLAVGLACGGGSSNQSHGTPAGTYAITVTGTSGSITHNATVSFTVQ